MDELVLVGLAGAITFGSRATFMVRPPRRLPESVRRFLDVFPLALFIALAVQGLSKPTLVDGASPIPAAFAVVGALVVGRRTGNSLLWMLAGGAAGYVVGSLL